MQNEQEPMDFDEEQRMNELFKKIVKEARKLGLFKDETDCQDCKKRSE